MCRAAEMKLLDRPVPYERFICPKCQAVVSNFRRIASRGAFPAQSFHPGLSGTQPQFRSVRSEVQLML